MLDIKFVRQHTDIVKQALSKRGDKVEIETFIQVDEERRTILLEAEKLKCNRNKVSNKIAKLKKTGKNTEKLVSGMREVSNKIKSLNKSIIEVEDKVKNILLTMPNIPDDSVPQGKDENDNIIEKIYGAIPKFDFVPKAHWDIGEKLNIFDFETASKITGSRFPLYLGNGARLERSLINFMLDTHTNDHGYKEVLPPFIVNRKTMTGTGQLPKFEEDLFKLEGWDYFLVPTAEVPVTNIHAGEILSENLLPLYYTAFTPCFRSEAGSYGRDTRGLLRQHQFNKVELVKFVKPESSFNELEILLNNAEKILQLLELPYRVVTLCSGDLGFSSAKTYDIEVWMPSQNVYREISSCSNFLDFQARRAGIQFKRKNRKKPEFVHTLNGSGLAVGRTVAAIIENNQQKDGSVIIPDVLQHYMGGLKRLEP